MYSSNCTRLLSAIPASDFRFHWHQTHCRDVFDEPDFFLIDGLILVCCCRKSTASASCCALPWTCLIVRVVFPMPEKRKAPQWKKLVSIFCLSSENLRSNRKLDSSSPKRIKSQMLVDYKRLKWQFRIYMWAILQCKL